MTDQPTPSDQSSTQDSKQPVDKIEMDEASKQFLKLVAELNEAQDSLDLSSFFIKLAIVYNVLANSPSSPYELDSVNKIAGERILETLKAYLISREKSPRTNIDQDIANAIVGFFDYLAKPIPYEISARLLEITKNILIEMQEVPESFIRVREIYIYVIDSFLKELNLGKQINSLVKEKNFKKAVAVLMNKYELEVQFPEGSQISLPVNRIEKDLGEHLAFVYSEYAKQLVGVGVGITIKEMGESLESFINLIRGKTKHIAILANMFAYLSAELDESESKHNAHYKFTSALCNEVVSAIYKWFGIKLPETDEGSTLEG